MNTNRKLWIGLALLLAVSFSVLLWVGGEIHRVMPPIPTAVVTQDGKTILTRADIEKERNGMLLRTSEIPARLVGPVA